ncbi:MAG: hypothetical protein US81_C0007G0022 [Parcubacteria group bacterium GW2011_GWE2_38_18]|nr:MAG: hypothetical protein US81_C0007G0022 [Parcubacteria group bacterium GW2011_GWE2_38_18]
MTLTTRRFLYITFILSFLIITPLVILYANGYTFSMSKKGIVKTGMLVLNTKPESANIYLNGVPEETFLGSYFGKKIKVTTPSKIKNIVPGEYLVRLEIENYWPWEKKLTVHPGGSTFAEDIILFKKDTPQILTADTKDTFQAPNNEFSLAYDGKSVSLVNLENGKSTIITEVSATPSITWSPNSTKFILNNTIYDTYNQEKRLELDQLDIKLENVKWNFSQEDIIYYKEKNIIYSLNIANKTRKQLLEQQIAGDYFIKDKYIFSLSRVNNDSSLRVIDLGSSQIYKTIKLPNTFNYEFINTENSLVNLFDKDKGILYLIDPFTDYLPIREIINNIKTAKWVGPGKLLYANDFEVWLYDLGQNKKTILNRLSEKISDVVWHPSNNYIIYSTENSINTLELDERDKFRTIELVDGKNINNLNLNKNGGVLYFQGNTGLQTGLFRLEI